MPSKPDPDKSPEQTEGRLVLVATPIGNLADVTLRALDTLRSVDIIAAEDTRHTRKLLSRYDIHKPLVSYHEHNARERGAQLLDKIAAGKSVAVVTDAGTPGISDPGALLVEEALKRGISPVAVPGPTAMIAALVLSGLPVQPFAFLGFAPARGAERRRFFEENGALPMTLVLYESPKRLLKTLRDILDSWGGRRVAVARELTKIHEEVFRGTVSEALAHFEAAETKGEITLVVEGRPAPEASAPEEAGWRDELDAMLAAGASLKEAASAVAARFSLPRRTVYQAALDKKR